MAADAAVFFGLWVQKPLRIAAANLAGPHLADALARFVELERPGPVLELGAGTGSLTRGLVRAGCPLERIIAVEQEPRFAAVLRRDFPGATVIEGNAARIGQYLAGHVERLSTIGVRHFLDRAHLLSGDTAGIVDQPSTAPPIV